MYKEFSRYYDDIFPAGANQLDFFKQVFENLGASRVLDLACGSGNYALEFARWGLQVVAVDSEQEMIRLAREKSRKAGLNVDFRTGDMRDLEDIEGKFDAVACIGNSLPHLLTDRDIHNALIQMKERLYPGGALILQTVNYDRILKNHITQLPDIVNKKSGLVFTRHYDLRNDGLIDFKTSLRLNQPDGSQRLLGSGQLPLRPLTSKEVKEFLQEAGFIDLQFYGDFKQKPLGWDSQAMVVQAFRKSSCSITW